MMIFRISHLSRIASVSPPLTPRGMPEYSCKSSHRRREIPSDKFKLNRSSPNDDIRCDKLRLFQLLLLSLCHKLSDDIFAIFEGFNVAQEVVKEEEKVKKDLTSIIPPISACHSTIHNLQPCLAGLSLSLCYHTHPSPSHQITTEAHN